MASGSTLNVRFGSDVVTPELTVAGQVNVSGSGSTLNANSSSGFAITSGSLNVTVGGLVQNTLGVVGQSGFGTATVSGPGSQWINSGTLHVGRGEQGEGTLDITGGGRVHSSNGRIGSSDIGFGVGTVNVSGDGSQWDISDSLSVGSVGVGTLHVTGGGTVTSHNGFIAQFFTTIFGASDGAATITGGNWTMTGRLSIGGDAVTGTAGGPGTLNIQPAGTVSAAQGVVIFP